MRGMILAAGEGSRMQPLTHARAKPSLPVLGVPLVVHSARLLRSAGIREIVVNLYHQGRSVREALEREMSDPRASALSDVVFRYSPEETLLGTGGGIGRVAPWLAEEGTAVVVNSDFLSDIDLPAVIDRHRHSGAAGTLVGAEPAGPFPGELWTDAEGRLLAIASSPPGLDVAGPLEFTGIQVLESELLARFPNQRCDSVRDVYLPAVEEGRLSAFRHRGYWWEFGSLERFLDGQLRLIERKAHSESGALLRLGDEGIAWLGAGADLSSGVKVRGATIIGAGARVRSGAQLEDVVILESALIPPGCRLNRCVIGSNTVLTGGSEFQDCAIVSAPCAPPTGLASSPETPGGRKAPPRGCRLLGDLWVRDIPRGGRS